jgi:branched-chain amino acid transport system permease protein
VSPSSTSASPAAIVTADGAEKAGQATTSISPAVFRLLVAAVLAALAICPALLNPFTVTLLNYIGVYSLVALGLVLLTGIGGMVSFGQAAFVGIGAYTTAFVTTRYAASPW